MRWATPTQLDEQLEELERPGSKPGAVLAIENELIEAATSIGDPVLEARTRRLIARDSLNNGDMNRADTLVRAALEVFEREQLDEHIATSKNILGVLARRRGDYASALEYFNDALAHGYEAGKLELCATVHNGLGCTYLENLGQYDEALSHFHRILELDREVPLSKVARTQVNIGCVYLEQGDLETALESLIRGLEASIEQEDRLGECAAALSLTEAYIKLGRQEDALEMGRHSVELASKMSGIIWQIQGLLHLSFVEREMGALQASERAALQALSLAQEHEVVRERGRAMEALAMVLLAAGRLDEASTYAEQLIALGTKLEHQRFEQLGREVHVDILEARGLVKEALAEMRTLRALEQEIAHSTRLEQLARVEVLHAVRQREAEADALRQHAEALTREVDERTTELAAQNEALRTARDAAQAATRAKDVFLSMISHELRTPLNAILGYSDMVRERLAEEPGDLFEQEIRDLDAVEQASVHLRDLVVKLIELSVLASDDPSLCIEDVDLHALVRDTLTEYAPLAARQGNLSPLPETSEALVWQTDRARLKRALDCIVENAHRFTRGGHVRATIERDGHDAIICIEDDGEGFEAEHLERLLEPFEQRIPSTTRAIDGLGLGLALTMRQLQAIGATLDVQSARGQGSRVQVSLPSRDQAAHSPSSS